MTWYAIRTKPGSQTPRLDEWAEPTKSRRGYRIASSTDPHQTLIERDLERAGIVHYMPAEYVTARDRRKTGLYTTHRFAMMKGYAFIEAGDDGVWGKLGKMDSVIEVVNLLGRPIPISLPAIHKLRMIEANSKAYADFTAQRLSKKEEIATSRARKASIQMARRRLFPTKRAKVLWGDHIGREATVLAWQDDVFIKALVDKLDASSEEVVVPYEFLRAAE